MSRRHRHSRNEVALEGRADLILDTVADLSELLARWSPTAWLMLAHAAAASGAGLEARAHTLARAAMLQRLPLLEYIRGRLTARIPDWPELATYRSALITALEDAALALVMTDAIDQAYYHDLLRPLHDCVGPIGLSRTDQADHRRQE